MAFQQTPATILCCLCGVPMQPNPSNTCINCIRSQIDITEGIPRQLSVFYCKGCGRYLNPPATWVFAELESKEMMTFCIKKVKGLGKVRLVDASFVWTEPHSRRIKVKLTIQKEVMGGMILQQSFIVEYIVQNKQCPDCARSYTENTWQSKVQLRQRVEHKKTFLYVEQLIIKFEMQAMCIAIKEQSDGLDFLFNQKSHAVKFVDFISSVVPVKVKGSEKLISHDPNSNIYHFNHTFFVEIVPLCRYDLVCLPKKVAQSIGSIYPLVFIDRVTSVVHCMDPNSLQAGTITAQTFWNHPFRPLASAHAMVKFVVLDIAPCGPVAGKYVLSDICVARECDLGLNDRQYLARTHLGMFVSPGDLVWGYDLSILNLDGDARIVGSLGGGAQVPDVLIVKKGYDDEIRNRKWKIKNLNKVERANVKNHDLQKAERDYEEFLRDIEEDADFRKDMALYDISDNQPILNTGDTNGNAPFLDELVDEVCDMEC